MPRRPSLAVFVCLLTSTAFGATYGCACLSGIPAGQRVRSFWEKTVQPLWKYGPTPELEQEERLEWIKPEKLPTPPKK